MELLYLYLEKIKGKNIAGVSRNESTRKKEVAAYY